MLWATKHILSKSTQGVSCNSSSHYTKRRKVAPSAQLKSIFFLRQQSYKIKNQPRRIPHISQIPKWIAALNHRHHYITDHSFPNVLPCFHPHKLIKYPLKLPQSQQGTTTDRDRKVLVTDSRTQTKLLETLSFACCGQSQHPTLISNHNTGPIH